ERGSRSAGQGHRPCAEQSWFPGSRRSEARQSHRYRDRGARRDESAREPERDVREAAREHCDREIRDRTAMTVSPAALGLLAGLFTADLVAAADSSVPQIRLTVAGELMQATNGKVMVDFAARHTIQDFVEEFREYRSGGSAQKTKFFENALAEEEPTAALAIVATITNTLAMHLSEHELGRLLEFCKGYDYRKFISSLPSPLVSMGILNLPHLSEDIPAHYGEPSKRDVQRIYARFVPADTLGKVRAFLSSNVGKQASLVLS